MVNTLHIDTFRELVPDDSTHVFRSRMSYDTTQSDDLVTISQSNDSLLYRWLMPDSEQTWYWSSCWQAEETEADLDLQNGDFEDFESMDDFIASL